ncbi:hypothetical protein JW906_10780 [bacterium]|nr:hypothetical protein [bacterium]
MSSSLQIEDPKPLSAGRFNALRGCRTFLATLLFLMLAGTLRAGRYANSFLEIGVGARALGMGGAFGSLGGDGISFYWNPAGLSTVAATQISAMYGPQFGTLRNPLGNYHYLGLAQPLPGRAAVSINWIRLAVDDIPVYPELQGNSYYDRLRDRNLRPSGEPDGYLSDVEDAFFLSFSKMNQWKLDLGWQFHRVRFEMPFGVNLKWMRQSVGGYTATGLGLDLGAQFRLHLEDFFLNDRFGILSMGLHLQDVTRTSMTWNTEHRRQETVPVNVKWGLAYTQPFQRGRHLLNLVWERDFRWLTRDHLGMEYVGFRRFSLRLGLDDGKICTGFGIRVWLLCVDYAFISHELDNLHRVSCAILLD